MSKLIAVTGATGQQGGSVVEYLLKYPESFTIRAITRNPQSTAAKNLTAKGVEVVKADLSNLDEVSSAFAGAWGIFAVTQFYEHGYESEQLHGKNMVEAAKANNVKHFVWSTVEGREGECKAISWTSKARIEDLVIESGIPWTFVYIPMYYENFFTPFFPPSYDPEKGFSWSVPVPPDAPIYSMSVEDFGGWVVPAFREPEKHAGVKVKICVEYLSMRDIVQQFSEVTGEKAYLGLELDAKQFEATRYGDNPLAETLYLSWEFVLRSGPGSGVKSTDQTMRINPTARTYRQWLKESQPMKDYVKKVKDEAVAKKGI
ncbi:NmrA family protein [Armillaria novae-zelandiae]|uniref:NmrA family protein n=1 Tax=Armillaria novae-zelandiae TaxID=153914 RepID=A0AA39P056_9AGAR|nr:NmrA family protein [Armillaria novae-zelandiae]